jgi:4'-phosphopantetheinyl transferase
MGIYWLEQTEAGAPDSDVWLSAREKSAFDALRFPKRRADWRLGRWTAKQAVAACLNLPSDLEALADIEIWAASSGAPEVLIAGHAAQVSISLSHRNGIALCTVGSVEIRFGCDLESVEPRSNAFIADYFTDTEKRLIEGASAEHRPELVTLMWSAKESALKALREGLRLDTQCVSVTPCAELQSSNLNPERWRPMKVSHASKRDFSGWWRVEGGLARTIVSTQPLEIPLRIQMQATAAR